MKYFIICAVFILFTACENSVKIKGDIESVKDADISVADEDTDFVQVPDTNDENIADDAVDEIVVPDDDTIGDGCLTNDDCGTDTYCLKDAGVCDAVTVGVCTVRPENCFYTRAIEPQCGCDNYTYSNECWAGSAGAVIAHAGECEGDVLCRDSSACSMNEYCQKKQGVCDMGMGVCRPALEDCNGQEDPVVCGCDLKQYTGECQAQLSGISVKHDGECNRNDDSLVRYFYADNAESIDGYLKIIVSPVEIKEFFAIDTFQEQFMDSENSVIITVRFYEKGDMNKDYAELQYKLSMPLTLPMGVGFGYEGSYLKWFSFDGGELGDMDGTVITYDYIPLDKENEVSTLSVTGLNLSMK
ncbi:MAG TPA: hypothetical protein PKG52_08785 [bacterium]|nr:hypothetical protein [bacterium]HPS29874.1 hypothetical protein [bacterium]